mmetsp:Transcript_28061/g.93270  ORF Transcript_28061/g.93270 Transcript_28061/m.93270 type:complete len:278 (-) Transcript_28061:114-947(-)
MAETVHSPETYDTVSTRGGPPAEPSTCASCAIHASIRSQCESMRTCCRAQWCTRRDETRRRTLKAPAVPPEATSCSPSASRRCTTPPTEARSAQSTSRRAAVSRPLTKRGTPPERSTATQRVHGPSWSASGSHSSAATQTHSQTCGSAPPLREAPPSSRQSSSSFDISSRVLASSSRHSRVPYSPCSRVYPTTHSSAAGTLRSPRWGGSSSPLSGSSPTASPPPPPRYSEISLRILFSIAPPPDIAAPISWAATPSPCASFTAELASSRPRARRLTA